MANEPPGNADERVMLTGWLDWHRDAVRSRLDGVAESALLVAPLPRSPLMTLAGLVSHLTAMETYWFAIVLAGEARELPWTDDDPEADWRVASGAGADSLLRRYAVACAHSDVLMDRVPLDAAVAGPQGAAPGSARTARWVLTHMIEETARHNGHAELVGELVTGVRH